jgi:catechol 2,3-dioxygenase-like lactoylglutathione lyase family enzyme
MEQTINTLVTQFEQGKLSRRQLVQGLLIAASSPAAAQAQSVPYPATGIDHVQITVADLNRTQQFYEKLFGAKVANRRATQMELHVGGSDYISPHTEAGRIKPIDHFGLAVPNFSPETAAATVQRVVPGTKVERTGAAVFIYDPDGVRVQLVARK